LFKSRPLDNISFDEFVSVVICIKNEEDNLPDLILDIINQDHKNFELILVDDNSTDSSRVIMDQFLELDSRIRIVSVPYSDHFFGSKKYALTLGIKACIHDIILFTDGDCRIPSPNWIQSMIRPYSKKSVEIILGYGAYQPKKGFLNAIIRFETQKTALLYMSFSQAGLPYMGVGRNLSYRKSLWKKTKGFSSHMDIRSGDDDLFISEAANTSNCVINTDPNSFTYSIPKGDLGQWIQQKRRHITTSNRYRNTHKFLLGLFYISELLFILLFPFIIYLNINSPEIYVLVSLGLNIFLSSLIFIKSKSILTEDSNLIYLPFLKLGLISLQMIIFIKNSITQTNRW
jgi:glycosyltransferase involved in cell wall biosynthesis